MKKTWIRCNACGSDAFRSLIAVGEWQIGRCARCSLIYVNPMPFFEATAEFSEISAGFEFTRARLQEDLLSGLDYERRQLRGQRERATRFGRLWSCPPRMLEVGCGTGAAVRAAADLGWEAVGVDIDPQLIDLGRRRFDVDLRPATLRDAGLEGSRFQFIRLRDVIEHLPDPYATLVQVRRLLAADGVALVVTPNVNGLPARLRRLLGRTRGMIATVPPPHHLHGFCTGTLRRMARRAGLEPLVVTTVRPVDPLYAPPARLVAARHPLRWLALGLAEKIGMGSILAAWLVARPGLPAVGRQSGAEPTYFGDSMV